MSMIYVSSKDPIDTTFLTDFPIKDFKKIVALNEDLLFG